MTRGGDRKGTIVIEWAAGPAPDDIGSYAWSVRCDPPLPDEVVAELLSQISDVY